MDTLEAETSRVYADVTNGKVLSKEALAAETKRTMDARSQALVDRTEQKENTR
jgi:hypothetical protein